MTHEIQTGTAPDPFNPAALRWDPSYAETVGVRRHLTTVPVRKPNRQEFFRVHPDDTYRLSPAAIVELKEDRETYLITPEIAQQLPDEFAVATFGHGDQSPGSSFHLAAKAPKCGRKAKRLAQVGGGGGRNGNETVDAPQGQHVAGCIRGV